MTIYGILVTYNFGTCDEEVWLNGYYLSKAKAVDAMRKSAKTDVEDTSKPDTAKASERMNDNGLPEILVTVTNLVGAVWETKYSVIELNVIE